MTALSSDIILFNGKICTMEDESFSTALAIRDGNIALLGSDSEVLETASLKTKIVDLSGRLTLPGFIDTHIHPSMAGELLTGKIDMKYYQPNSIPQLLDVVKKYAQKASEGEWLTGWGYDEERLAEKRHPTKWDLDQAAPKNPVFLTQTCGHVAACNSSALAIGGLGKETPDPNQGIIDRNSEGEPTGVLRNRAQEIVKRHITSTKHAMLKDSLSKACERLSSWGVTGIHDAWAGPSVIKAYQELLSEGKLPLRVGLMPPIANPFEGDYLKELTTLRIRTGFGNSMLRIVGVRSGCTGMWLPGADGFSEGRYLAVCGG